MFTISRLLIVLTLAGASLAATPFDLDRVKLKNGKWLVGEGKSYDPETRVVVFIDENGTERTIQIDELDPRSAYRVAYSNAKTAEPERLVSIGNFARDIGMYAHAVRHYKDAVRKDPALKERVDAELVILRREAAVFCMKNAEKAMQKGDAKQVEKWLTTLVQKLPDEPQAETAAAMLAQRYAKHHEAKDDELEQRYADLLRKELETGKRYYDDMLEKIETGLTARNLSSSRRALENAYRDGSKALGQLDKVQKRLEKKQPDRELGELFDGYRVLVKEHMVEAQLHLASILTASTSYQQAMKEVNKALAIDAGNRDALAARVRIEEAARSGWRW